jgi:hypothetical protein
MRATLLVLLLVSACCRCRIPEGQSGAYSQVACGSVVTAELPRPAKCFDVKLLKRSDCNLQVEIHCEGEAKPWTRTLKPGEWTCYCCEGERPRIRKIVLRCLGDDPRGVCIYCATTRDSCPV